MFRGVYLWDLAPWAVMTCVAVVTLARLLAYQRYALVARFHSRVASQRRRHAGQVEARKRQQAARAPEQRNTAA